MKKFKALIKDKRGQKSLTIKANSKLQAQRLLHSKGYKLIKLNQINQENFFKNKIKPRMIIFTFKELFILLNAGISLQQSFEELYKSSDDKNLQLALKELKNNLQSGQSPSQAFENSIFNLTQGELALIKMGENTGELALVFSQIYSLREKSLNNKKRLLKALTYPAFVFVSLVFAFFAMMFFVVPQFKSIFDEFGVNLPLITRILLACFDFLNDYFYILLLISFALVFLGMFLYKRSFNFAYQCDAFILKLPFVGKMIFYHANTQFFFIFSLLLKNGISISKCLELARLSLTNKALAQKYSSLNTKLSQGISLDEAFKSLKLFENIILSMLKVAMLSAKLDEISGQISQFYETKQEDMMQKFLSALEPLMTFVVAILVLFLALGIFLPMWELNNINNLN